MRHELLGTPIDVLDFSETMELCELAMVNREICVHVAMNAAKFVKMRSDNELRQDVTNANIIGIDGMGIAFALRFFGIKEVPKVSGVDLMIAILARCAQTGHRPYILGAKQDVLDNAIETAQKRWPGLQMAGSHNGYFTSNEEQNIVSGIQKSEADCLFIAMPTPRKERFLSKYSKDLGVPFIMGVGGSIDILAGHVKRAPQWMQRCGLEWFYRFVQEPQKMFWRYASTNGHFIALIIAGRLRGASLTAK